MGEPEDFSLTVSDQRFFKHVAGMVQDEVEPIYDEPKVAARFLYALLLYLDQAEPVVADAIRYGLRECSPARSGDDSTTITFPKGIPACYYVDHPEGHEQ